MSKRGWGLVFAGVLATGGCGQVERVTPAASLAAPEAAPRVVSYPEGRYELRGDGAAMPFHWVWVPAAKGAPPLKSQ